MRTRFLAVMLSLLVFGALAPIPALAADNAPTASADIGIFSKYVWRGFELSHNSMVIQPAAGVSYMGFSLGFWGNLDTNLHNDLDSEPDRDEAKWNETDLTLAYDREIGPVSLGVGYIYYALDGVDDSREVYVSLGLATILSPTLTVYREIAHAPAWYISLGVSHSFALPYNISLDLGASAGYYLSDDDEFTEIEDPSERYRAWHDGLVSVGLTIPLGKYCSIAPMVAYTFPLSDKADDLIRAASISDKSSFFYGGVTVSFAF